MGRRRIGDDFISDQLEREAGTRRTYADLQARIEVLEGICGEAYQMAGIVEAPLKVLDNLVAAADGRAIPHSTFLPLEASDFGWTVNQVMQEDKPLEIRVRELELRVKALEDGRE